MKENGKEGKVYKFRKNRKSNKNFNRKKKKKLAKVHTYKDQTPSRKNSQLKKIICETLTLIANIARITNLTKF